ncbi:MAG TPA: glucose-6-phosphate dehydrogenase assembly protein OpcA [Ktedonobacterales bacterium]|jgi:glucose-6-phosphate dehydrogenase assembly protein OpcA|nr:glucose-6-phosphate dehydrogenase assembly protein OpcA [Ktedonobacterales bacterium]
MTDLRLDKQFRQVALGDIEAALDELWREITENALASGRGAVSRNTVLTLVAYTTTIGQAHLSLRAAEELAVQHPARTAVLLTEPDQPDAAIDVQVAVRGEGMGLTAGYSEEIVIEARGDAAHQVSGVVLPLMASGVPAFLWWHGEPPWGGNLVETLVDGIDRLIVDSGDAGDADRFLSGVADLVRRKHAHCALSDFNWARQTPWREMTAQFFDPVAVLPYLSGVDRVTVEYAAGDEDAPTNSAPAYLFVGWLAARLGWTVATANRRSFGPSRQHTLHDSAHRPVLVEVNARTGLPTGSWYAIHDRQRRALNPSASGSWPGVVDGRSAASAPGASATPEIGDGALMSVRIHAVTAGRRGTFIIARDQDLEHATTLCQVDGSAPPSHTVHLGSLGETALLHSQLELVGHDAIYEEAVHKAAQLAGYEPNRRAL